MTVCSIMNYSSSRIRVQKHQQPAAFARETGRFGLRAICRSMCASGGLFAGSRLLGNGRHVPDTMFAGGAAAPSPRRSGDPGAPPMPYESEEDIAQAEAHEGDLLEEDDEPDHEDDHDEGAQARLRLQVDLLAARVAHWAHHEARD